MITFRCPGCSGTLSVPEEQWPELRACPYCRADLPLVGRAPIQAALPTMEVSPGADTALISPGAGPDGPSPAVRGASAGAQFPGFELKGELGRGAFGAVYLAREHDARRDVAIKALSDPLDLASPQQRQRFLEEALVTAQLQHPGIVPIYRVARNAAGRVFYAMRPIEGRTLEAVLAALRAGEPAAVSDFPLNRLVRIFLAVSDTVRFAHDRGVVHRDLKPANIVVGEYGEVLVIDWGMAKVLEAGGRPEPAASPAEAGAALTGSAWERFQREVESLRAGHDSSLEATTDGTVAGTPCYMAPEQAAGLVAEVDARTDIWALGVVLYELCTLRRPFDGGSFLELAKSIVTGQYPDPLVANPRRRVPPELGAAIARCLRIDRRERFASAGELAAAVRGWLEGAAPWTPVADVDFATAPDGPPAGWTATRGEWTVADGTLRRTGGKVEGLILLDQPVPGDVRVEVEASVAPGEMGEISVMLSAPAPGTGGGKYDGYCLQCGAEGNTRAKIAKNGPDLVTADLALEPGRTYQVRAERVGGVLRIELDGAEVLSYRDYVPVAGDRVGLYTWGSGLRLRRLRVWGRGVAVLVSCLDVPGAFYNRGILAEALAEYLRIAESHPARPEGQEALLLAVRCVIDLARRAEGAERERLIGQACDLCARLEQGFLAPLGCLGWAMVHELRGAPAEEAAELQRAYRDYPGYEALGSVGERLWERGAAMLRGGQPELGRLFLEPAVRLHPDGLRSISNLSTVALSLPRPAAIEVMAEAVRLNPGTDVLHGFAFQQMAVCFEAEGRLEEALDRYRRAAEAWGNEYHTGKFCALCLLGLDRTGEALALCERLAAELAALPSAAAELGLITAAAHAAAGRAGAAREILAGLQPELERTGDDPRLRGLVAAILAGADGRRAEAAAGLRDCAAGPMGDFTSRLARALLRAMDGGAAVGAQNKS